MYTIMEVFAWMMLGIGTGFTGGYTLGLKEGKREGFIRGKIAARKNMEVR
jgi:hypothetical protein